MKVELSPRLFTIVCFSWASSVLAQNSGPPSWKDRVHVSPNLLAPMPHYWMLTGSILLLVLSLFLFIQSNQLQQFAFRGVEDAPKASSGSKLVLVSVFLVIVISGTLSYLQYVEDHLPPRPFSESDFKAMYHDMYRNLWGPFLFQKPLALAPAFVFASLLPSALAIYKFLIVKSINPEIDSKGVRLRIGNAFIGVCASILSITASAATLVTFFFLSKR